MEVLGSVAWLAAPLGVGRVSPISIVSQLLSRSSGEGLDVICRGKAPTVTTISFTEMSKKFWYRAMNGHLFEDPAGILLM